MNHKLITNNEKKTKYKNQVKKVRDEIISLEEI